MKLKMTAKLLSGNVILPFECCHPASDKCALLDVTLSVIKGAKLSVGKDKQINAAFLLEVGKGGRDSLLLADRGGCLHEEEKCSLYRKICGVGNDSPSSRPPYRSQTEEKITPLGAPGILKLVIQEKGNHQKMFSVPVNLLDLKYIF